MNLYEPNNESVCNHCEKEKRLEHETETFFYRAALTGLEALAQTISLVVLYLSQSLPSNDSGVSVDAD
jgi:hypothetical protein